ncbi:MAG: hypothetical protein COB85_00770 [Bacteroidetes bacterium]|nr:MAG: hypothetical protein COB85_00770 [Bacteroidota bacterium]
MLRELNSMFASLIRNMGGALGRRLRYYYYRGRMKSCGVNIRIDEGVFFEGVRSISLGSNVWIDKHCVLIAGRINQDALVSSKSVGQNDEVKSGDMLIGNNVHLGISTVIQAHGGVKIGNHFTSGPGSKIYSFSNDVRKSKAGTHGEGDKYYVLSPIVIHDNVWLGMNTSVFGGVIGKNSFIMPNSYVIESIESNSIAKGSPAVKISNRFEDDTIS